ncbi:MAG TPA: hypothetical protein VFV13_11285 [Acidimicrobiia bacterium]|nr:hypothetical protein [Acidimicrobiia bacterium]
MSTCDPWRHVWPRVIGLTVLVYSLVVFVGNLLGARRGRLRHTRPVAPVTALVRLRADPARNGPD